MHGTDLVFAGKHESFSSGRAPVWGCEEMLESETTDIKHGWEEEVHPDKGGGGETDSASGKEREVWSVGRKGTASFSVWDSVPDRCLWAMEEVSDGRGLGVSSLCGVIIKLVLQDDWLTSSSSSSKSFCSAGGQNGSSTCWNTRNITPKTGNKRQIHTSKIKLTYRTYNTIHRQRYKVSSHKKCKPRSWILHMQTYTLTSRYQNRCSTS